jgi:hypothetical protein
VPTDPAALLPDAHAVVLWRGEPVKVSYVTQAIKRQVAPWLRRRALAEAYEDKAFLPPDQYADLIDSISDKAAAGGYAYMGDAFRRATRTESGVVGWLAILTGKPEADAEAMLRDEPGQVVRAVEEVMVESMPAEARDAARAAIAEARAALEGRKAGLAPNP